MKMNRKRPWMGKLLSVVLALMIGFSAWNITPAYTLEVQAAEESQEVDLTEMFSSVKGQIKEALDKIDHETAVSMFDSQTAVLRQKKELRQPFVKVKNVLA